MRRRKSNRKGTTVKRSSNAMSIHGGTRTKSRKQSQKYFRGGTVL